MKQKLKVVHYCNQMGIGGTERTMELFCKYLDRSVFDVYAVSVYRTPPNLQRLKVELGSLFGNSKAIGKKRLWKSLNARIPNFRTAVEENRIVVLKNTDELETTLREISPDVLHVHYSGNPELPTSNENILSKIPITVTTNQFEIENTSASHRYVKKMFFVSNWMLQNKAHWAKNDPRAEVFYNLIEEPIATETLRDVYNIPENAFVIGRIGRADSGIHDPISLSAYAEIQSDQTYFLAISAPENMEKQAKSLKVKNFISIPPTTDPKFLSKFYNTIDVLAHARRDGETFGCNIAEAMMHGKPVVSHLTPFMNAQQEIIGDGGIVVGQDDWQAYAKALREFKENPQLRNTYSEKAKARALEAFEAQRLTRRLEKVYLDLISSNISPGARTQTTNSGLSSVSR